MPVPAGGRGTRPGGRVVYSRKDPLVDLEHRRAIDEALQRDREATRAGARDYQAGGPEEDWNPAAGVPVPLPAVTFFADDGSEVASLSANAGRTDADGSPGISVPRHGSSPGGTERADQRPLFFSAAFESGNLYYAKMVRAEEPDGRAILPRYEYELLMDNDTSSEREHTQWFYFAVFNTVPCSVLFRITNFRKRSNLYRVGMQPHVRATSAEPSSWDATSCSEVSYAANARTNGAPQHFTLSFRYDFRTAKDIVFFGGHTPYTLSMLRTFLAKLGSHPSARRHFAERELCTSLGGLKVPLLLITAGLPEDPPGRDRRSTAEGATFPQLPAEAQRRPAVVVIARQHPGETVGSHVVSGLVAFLLGDSPDAQALRESFCFHVVPMVNVDGVVYGNSRCTLAGVDPNRCWLNPSRDRHPEVHALREHVARVQQAAGVRLFLDLHGHSQQVGAFFYGNCPEQIRSALFPKLVSLGTRDVDFDRSRWRFARAHNQSARAVVFNHCRVFNSFTLETSFFAQKLVPAAAGGDSPPPRAAEARHSAPAEDARLRALHEMLFTPSRAESIGRAVGWAMVTFFDVRVEAPGCGHERADPRACPACPWLTYAQLRRATAGGVLASLQAAGQTVFDLQGRGARAACEEDLASDSDNGPEEEEDETAAASPVAQRGTSRQGGVPALAGKRASAPGRAQEEATAASLVTRDGSRHGGSPALGGRRAPAPGRAPEPKEVPSTGPSRRRQAGDGPPRVRPGQESGHANSVGITQFSWPRSPARGPHRPLEGRLGKDRGGHWAFVRAEDGGPSKKHHASVWRPWTPGTLPRAAGKPTVDGGVACESTLIKFWHCTSACELGGQGACELGGQGVGGASARSQSSAPNAHAAAPLAEGPSRALKAYAEILPDSATTWRDRPRTRKALPLFTEARTDWRTWVADFSQDTTTCAAHGEPRALRWAEHKSQTTSIEQPGPQVRPPALQHSASDSDTALVATSAAKSKALLLSALGRLQHASPSNRVTPRGRY